MSIKDTCFSIKFSKIAFIIAISLLSQSCSINKAAPAPKLDSKEFLLIDGWVKNNLASCSFLFGSIKNINIKEVNIMRCIEEFDLEYQQSSEIPEYLKKKIFLQRIDYYLTSKISSYLSNNKLSILQLTNILYFVANTPFGENVNLVRLLIGKGADTKNITVQHNLSTNGSTCRSSLAILKANQNLYRAKSELNKPVSNIYISLLDKGFRKEILDKIYRKDVLFYLLEDPAYSHCRSPIFLPKLIGAVVRVNSSLRDVVDTKTGRTPLHLYCRYFQTRGLSNPVALGKLLMNKSNINKMDKRGWTPLHTLLVKQSLNQSEEYALMVKALIDAGANIDLKDENGVSARSLIFAHPKY